MTTKDDGIGFDVTCPASRHAELIADELIEHGDCPQLSDDGPRCGESIRSAVGSLYKARAEIKKLTAEVERHRMTPEKRVVVTQPSQIVADARAWLAERGPQVRTDHERCHTYHVECLVVRLLEEIERLQSASA